MNAQGTFFGECEGMKTAKYSNYVTLMRVKLSANTPKIQKKHLRGDVNIRGISNNDVLFHLFYAHKSRGLTTVKMENWIDMVECSELQRKKSAKERNQVLRQREDCRTLNKVSGQTVLL